MEAGSESENKTKRPFDSETKPRHHLTSLSGSLLSPSRAEYSTLQYIKAAAPSHWPTQSSPRHQSFMANPRKYTANLIYRESTHALPGYSSGDDAFPCFCDCFYKTEAHEVIKSRCTFCIFLPRYKLRLPHVYNPPLIAKCVCHVKRIIGSVRLRFIRKLLRGFSCSLYHCLISRVGWRK